VLEYRNDLSVHLGRGLFVVLHIRLSTSQTVVTFLTASCLPQSCRMRNVDVQLKWTRNDWILTPLCGWIVDHLANVAFLFYLDHVVWSRSGLSEVLCYVL